MKPKKRSSRVIEILLDEVIMRRQSLNRLNRRSSCFKLKNLVPDMTKIRGLSDEKVLAMAEGNQQVLVTFDRGFLSMDPRNSAIVVVSGGSGLSAVELQNRLLLVFDKFSSYDEIRGKVLIAKDGKVEVRGRIYKKLRKNKRKTAK